MNEFGLPTTTDCERFILRENRCFDVSFFNFVKNDNEIYYMLGSPFKTPGKK